MGWRVSNEGSCGDGGIADRKQSGNVIQICLFFTEPFRLLGV